MKGRHFDLTQDLSDFVDRQVAEGRHDDASDVVREALRLYEEDLHIEQDRLAEIAVIARDGLAAVERGDLTEIRSKADLDRLFDDLNADVAHKISRGPAIGPR